MWSTAGTAVRLALLVFLVGFEAVVGIAALHPEVSDSFRGFFIDRTTDCWPKAVSGAYTIGEKVSFMPGAPGARELKSCGWADPTGEGTWATGPEARLLFAVDGGGGALDLELDILGFVTPTHLEQHIEIAANGGSVATLLLKNGSLMRQVVHIPGALANAQPGRIEISFRFLDAVSPQAVGLGNDRRRLAARLLSVRLTPAPAPAPAVALGGRWRAGL